MRVLAIALTFLVVTPALADALKLAGRFDHWAAYVYEGPDGKICYAATKPRTWGPAEAAERLTYLQVSTFQNQGVSDEVSITLGAQLDSGAPARALIRKESLPLIVVSGQLRAADEKAQKTLLQRMRKGRTLKVEARAATGRELEYNFSLRGMDKALKQSRKDCG